MADKKISALTAASTPLAGTEVLPIVQSGTTVKVSIDNVTKGRTVNAATFDTDVAAAKATLSGTTLAAGGSNTNVSLRIDPKGSGGVGFSVTPVNKVQIFQASTASPPAAGAGGHAFALGETGFGLASGTLFSGNSYLQATRWDGSAVNYNLVLQPNGGDVNTGAANIVIGTAGKGIDFSANADAPGMTSELLSYYAEGAWVPSQGAGLTVVGTFSSNGTYTRIGRMVTVRGIVSSTTTVACSSAGIICGNLPFAAALDMAGSYFNGDLSSGGVVDASSTNVYAVGPIAATGAIYFTITYFV